MRTPLAIVDDTEDRRLRVDYQRFHDTVPVDPSHVIAIIGTAARS